MRSEAEARLAQEEAYLSLQQLQDQLKAMSARIGELEALLATMIDDVEVENLTGAKP